jgi:hypothetical protein
MKWTRRLYPNKMQSLLTKKKKFKKPCPSDGDEKPQKPNPTPQHTKKTKKKTTLLHKNGRGRKTKGINIQEPVPEQQQHEERR